MLERKQRNIPAFINMLWIHSYLDVCSVQQTTYCSTATSLFMHFLLVFIISWVVDGSHNYITEVEICIKDFVVCSL